MEENRKKALVAALGQIEKQFGKGSVMRLGDSNSYDVEVISTGSLGLDIALGVGGLPKGRVVEIYGPESSGKTTLARKVRSAESTTFDQPIVWRADRFALVRSVTDPAGSRYEPLGWWNCTVEGG